MTDILPATWLLASAWRGGFRLRGHLGCPEGNWNDQTRASGVHVFRETVQAETVRCKVDTALDGMEKGRARRPCPSSEAVAVVPQFRIPVSRSIAEPLPTIEARVHELDAKTLVAEAEVFPASVFAVVCRVCVDNF